MNGSRYVDRGTINSIRTVERAPFAKIKFPMIDKHIDFSHVVDDHIHNPLLEEHSIYKITGCIVKITESYILLFAPIAHVWKVLVKRSFDSPYVRKGHRIELGQWMSLEVVPRCSQPFDRQYPPRFSHIATTEPEFFDIKRLIPHWKQRFNNGMYQICVTVNLANSECREVIADRRNYYYYLVKTDCQLVAIVPAHRLVPIVDVPNHEKNILRFWVSRGRFIFGHCVHLFEDSEIEEILPDGSIRIHVSPLKHADEYAQFLRDTNQDDSSSVDDDIDFDISIQDETTAELEESL